MRVICVGNPYRRDDGVGLAVLRELAGVPGVTAVEATGDAASLLSLWADEPQVVLVDAISAGAPPGTVHELHCRDGRWTVPPPSAPASTHGLGVAAAIELGRALGQLPREVTLLGVEAGDCGHGEGLTAPVAAAVPEVVRRIREV